MQDNGGGEDDVALDLAHRTNERRDDEVEVPPETFWDGLGMLADIGLLESDQERLGRVRIGPFRWAAAADPKSHFFVETLLPIAFAGEISGHLGPAELAIASSVACKAYTTICRRGYRFGNDRVDRVRWLVLVAVDVIARGPNTVLIADLGRDVVGQIIEGGRVTLDEVADALEWLCDPWREDGERIPPFIEMSGDDAVRSLL